MWYLWVGCSQEGSLLLQVLIFNLLGAEGTNSLPGLAKATKSHSTRTLAVPQVKEQRPKGLGDSCEEPKRNIAPLLPKAN